MITWPTELPQPSVDFGNKVEPSVLRTQMDTGRFRQRQRFTRANRTIGIQWLLNDTEYALVEGLFQHTLHGGADWFTLPLNLGDGQANQTVRFVGGLSTSYVPHLHWRVTATLEVENGAVWDAETTDAVVLVGVSEFTRFELAVSELSETVEPL